MTRFIARLAVVVVLASFAASRSEAEPRTPAKAKESKMSTSAESAKPKLDPNNVDLDKVDPEQVDWSKVNWRRRLTPEQYYVTRKAGTERAFTGEYDQFFEEGQYRCVSCGLPLFESVAKFNSHCGWPSFDKTIAQDSVLELADSSHGMRRIEVRCRRCDAHLGHVFDDGPTDTGLRYCMNSVALQFIPADEVHADAERRAADAKTEEGTTKGTKDTK